jgi:TatD DNase family protein
LSKSEYFDTHAHLTDRKFEHDIQGVVERAQEAGVGRILNVGDGLESSRACVEMARHYDVLLPAIGVHPHNARSYNSATERALVEIAESARVYAVGEIGLDYHYEFTPRDVQKEVFERQLRLAHQLNLPVIMHCREAYDDLLQILERFENPRKGVAHCFSGTAEDAERLQAMGYFLGVAGPVTLPNAERLRAVVREMSLNRVLLETDSPYLAPVPKRGQRNEPSNIPYIAKQAATLKSLSDADIARVTYYNSHKAFGLSLALQPEIAYQIRNSLYLNITNGCTNRCIFCRRQSDYMALGHYLKLPEEPTIEQILAAMGDPTGYDEVVFCGYGEPTLRLDAIKEISARLRKKGVRVRLDTNGQGNLIHGRNICPELQSLVQAVSISLNAATQADYNAICSPRDELKAYPSIMDFVRTAKRSFDDVVVSVVNFPGVDVQACRCIAEDLGVSFRVRHYTRFI